MNASARTRPDAVRPVVRGTARVDRRLRAVLPRVRSGDVVVLDHLDLDRTGAQALVDAGAVAVVNASPMISGRFPNQGPQVLLDAGLLVLDNVEGAFTLKDGAEVRVEDEVVFAGDRAVATGRRVDAGTVERELEAARGGLATQLESFTHNSVELLRREQDLFLDHEGVPRLNTRVRGRPVVVVGTGPGARDQMARAKTFLREQNPVLIGVDGGADALVAAGYKPHVVVLTDGLEAVDRPRAQALRKARDVVVRVERGHRLHAEGLERLGVQPQTFATSATTEDAALLLAASESELVVGIGLTTSFEQLLDRQRPGQASAYLTRLAIGPSYVDATVLDRLYSGRVRPWHLFLVYLGGLVALLAAISVTPVGQEWAHDAFDFLQGLLP
jgi:uncharacterized membrane-anchored protein